MQCLDSGSICLTSKRGKWLKLWKYDGDQAQYLKVCVSCLSPGDCYCALLYEISSRVLRISLRLQKISISQYSKYTTKLSSPENMLIKSVRLKQEDRLCYLLTLPNNMYAIPCVFHALSQCCMNYSNLMSLSFLRTFLKVLYLWNQWMDIININAVHTYQVGCSYPVCQIWHRVICSDGVKDLSVPSLILSSIFN